MWILLKIFRLIKVLVTFADQNQNCSQCSCCILIPPQVLVRDSLTFPSLHMYVGVHEELDCK